MRRQSDAKYANDLAIFIQLGPHYVCQRIVDPSIAQISLPFITCIEVGMALWWCLDVTSCDIKVSSLTREGLSVQ